jgi:hypothetical protein
LEDPGADGRIILIWFREELDAKQLRKWRIYGIVLKSVMRLMIQ